MLYDTCNQNIHELIKAINNYVVNALVKDGYKIKCYCEFNILYVIIIQM